LYTVDGSLHTRKDLQLVKGNHGNVIKHQPRPKHNKNNMIYRIKWVNSLNNPEVKDLVGTRTKKETKEVLESDRKTRSQTTSSTMNLRSRK
jgi:hypothetical protein